MTLTKDAIAKKIANDCGFMKGEAYEIVEKVPELMKRRLIAGEDVMISGFGRWNVKSKHARRGGNPKTGEEIVLDARKVVTWKYSPVLKKAVGMAGKGLKRGRKRPLAARSLTMNGESYRFKQSMSRK